MFTAPTNGGACGRLVLVEPAMASATPRLMLAPPGARLPPGVHEVAPVIVVPAGFHRGRLPRGARAVVAAAAGSGDGMTALGLRCFSSSALAAAAPVGVCFAADGTRVIGLGTGAPPRTRRIGAAGSSTPGEQRHLFGFPATAPTATARCATPTGSRPATAAAIGVAGSMAVECDVYGSFPTSVTGRGASMARARPTPIVALPGAGIGGSRATARMTSSALGAHMTSTGLCFGDSASTRFIGFAADYPSSRSGRNYVPRALDLGDGDGHGDGEEDPADEHAYQLAHRQMRNNVYLVCLRRRVEVASDLGLIQSGREHRLILQGIGVISPAAPVYHWVIDRVHSGPSDILGADLYKEIFSATPSDEKQFKWIVEKDSEVIVSITTLMAEIQYSILHTETWRAVVRDHPVYDMCPLFLDKLAECAAEFFTNIALACFKRPFPPITQRMVENHALAVVHLYKVLLDLYETMFDEQAADPKKIKELLARYGILFVQDIDPQDYISGIGDADVCDLLLLLNTVTPEVRNFRRKWM